MTISIDYWLSTWRLTEVIGNEVIVQVVGIIFNFCFVVIEINY